MQTRLIGIAGKAGAGKDTLASHIVRQHGFTQTSFAAPLKIAASAIFSIPKKYFELREFKDTRTNGQIPRERLVNLADVLRTAYGEMVFVDPWRLVHQNITKNGGANVVSDVRFEVEAEAIQSLGGVIIYIDRPGTTCSMASHPTEHYRVKKTDYVLENNGTISDLLSAFDKLAAGF